MKENMILLYYNTVQLYYDVHIALKIFFVFKNQNLIAIVVMLTVLKTWTSQDVLLSQVLGYILSGWPDTCDNDVLKSFYSRRMELSTQAGCLLWGNRAPPGRQLILDELHAGHPGVSRMKSVTRMFVWWPRLDSDVEDWVKFCSDCQKNCPSPPIAPVQRWKWPMCPWARVLGRIFLIAIDAHSKWMEVDTMSSTTSMATIQLRTDNEHNFVSEEFKEFFQKNGIKHTTSAPYHPSTNRLAECAVQTFKQGLTKLKESTINEGISRFLFNYRITTQSTTGTSTAELLLGRRPQSRLDLLKADLSIRIETKQAKQCLTSNSRTVPNYKLGDAMYVRNFGYSSRWIPGVENTGPLSFKIECEGGRIFNTFNLYQSSLSN